MAPVHRYLPRPFSYWGNAMLNTEIYKEVLTYARMRRGRGRGPWAWAMGHGPYMGA